MEKYGKMMFFVKKKGKKLHHSNWFLAITAGALFVAGLTTLWVASLRIPALEDIHERRIEQSTKIYDRTGEILLYDMSRGSRRISVPIENISRYAQMATIAIEDKNFYSHNGFQLSGFVRAVLVNLTTLSFSQGGSTITQQVVKNSILTMDKSPIRKIKELVLALKLEKVMTKEEILELYLNEAAYGGTMYGIEEASKNFFGKTAAELTLAESTYLAAILQAPTFYSPYGKNSEALEARKNLVLTEMLKNEMVSQEEFEAAANEEVVFLPRQNLGTIRAPHFVFLVIDKLTAKYGEDLANKGFKVITTLDYSLQQEAEALAKKYGAINQERFKGENNAMVAIDPKSGGILMMVGSRDYFDTEIDGNFNASLGLRQPGSTFKPFVYATMFNKGYTDQTILYDAAIQFSPNCEPYNFTSEGVCYAPGNYDNRFRGPMTIRNALAQSVNLPAVQATYLAGVVDSVNLARSMGVESLTRPQDYGLSLALGGGSVTLLDMTSAYSVFANDGVRNPYNAITYIEDASGNVIDRHTPFPHKVLNEQTSRMITDILWDNVARTPGFGANSSLYIPSRPVAVKTGTSNDYRDAWIIGYTPNLVVGAWVGNNDNREMERRVSGLVVAPLWREYVDKILPRFPVENFIPPERENLSDLKPILRGDWQTGGIHSILYWVNKNDPRGPEPSNPASDPQFRNWEYGVALWALSNGHSAQAPTIETSGGQ